MSFKLKISGKASALGYPALIVGNFVNEKKQGSIEIEFVDDKFSDDSSIKLETQEGKTVHSQFEALNEIWSAHKDALANNESSVEWTRFSLNNLYVKNFKELSTSLEKLDSHLNLRSFITGYNYSLADVTTWGVLRANAMMGSILKNEVYANISRWYNFISMDKRFEKSVEEMSKTLITIRKSVNASKGTKKETHRANFDIDLPNAEIGKVVTRFPPEPSGYLHIGHAKAAILNEYFAHTYKGKLIIRFDDTNPSKEKVEFQDSIIEDLALLGVKGDILSYSSDYFDKMYELAIQLIKSGKAYIDDTETDKMRAERMDGIASARRDRPIEESIKIFTEEMKNGTEIGLKNCLRAKIDYKALNKALRDPVIYRCNLTPHHRTGSQWKMYPLYDFCVPVVDSLEGVTHALRTIEYKDRDAQYEWFLEALNLRKVHLWEFARVNFVRTLLSKRKLQWFVDKQHVSNWDDPRFPTVRGVRRRGMTVEGLRNFVISQGPSKNIINLDWSIIWALNKKVIDPVAPRFTAINEENAVTVSIVGALETPVTETRQKHKKNPDVGTKPVVFANKVLIEQADAEAILDNEEITLMDWGNVIVTDIEKEGSTIKSIKAKLHLEGDFRKTSKKITWLADTEDKTEVTLIDFDHLITKDKLDENDNFEDFLTPQTEFTSKAFADLNVRSLSEGDIIQFERKGYYRVDAPYSEDKGVVLYLIPDGKHVSKYGAKK